MMMMMMVTNCFCGKVIKMSLHLKIIFLSLFSIYCLLKILEMLEIYLYTDSQSAI